MSFQAIQAGSMYVLIAPSRNIPPYLPHQLREYLLLDTGYLVQKFGQGDNDDGDGAHGTQAVACASEFASADA